MVRFPKLVVILVLASSLAANPAHASSGISSVKITLKTKISRDFSFITDLLQALKTDGVNCTNYQKTQGMLMVREEGTCTFNRKTLTLDLFADDKSAAFMFHNGASYVSGYLVGTNNWGITVDDASTAKILLGGLKLKLF